MHKKIIISCIVLVLLVAGLNFFVARNRGTDVVTPEITSVSYSDGEEVVEASFNIDAGTVTFSHPDLGTVTLPQAISGSGARYANEDESIVFWEHQGEATITDGGVTVFQGKIQ